RVTIEGPMANIFYIFTEGKVCNKLPDLCLGAPTREIIYVATRGACVNNNTPDTRARAGYFVDGKNRMEITLKLLLTILQTFQAGEATA
ncbi:hypothetical protein EDD18DRAFT_1050569, partial [Armillaria luteobubalina]